MINNHYSAKLSDLDIEIISHVPIGGNWKNIPLEIPSKRLQTIRDSYARGEGSRSTYYGRLNPSKPSYTINTYFNRPGNGCNIHYKENRVISQREAARFQSFPDYFLFKGSKRQINMQIGNAVPPLLAFQISKSISFAQNSNGIFIDLFSGAGGIGLGFKWNNWIPIVANDIEKSFLDSYSYNIHNQTIHGSINNNDVFEEIIKNAKNARKKFPDKPLWILGGPPCQGFSTAGKRRSMDDPRNHLFYRYCELVKALSPDGFLFENVAGILTMKNGEIFREVNKQFMKLMPYFDNWLISSECYGIPQKRKRVFLIGNKNKNVKISIPPQITSQQEKNQLFSYLKPLISSEEAISDLPEILHNEDGSHKVYKDQKLSTYQKFMRSILSPSDYLKTFQK